MKTFAAVTIAALIGMTGAVPASAALSSREAAPILQTRNVEVAARGGGRNDRSGNRDARRDRNDKQIWRIRDKDRKRERPFFLFRGRGGDCRTEKIQVRDFNGNLIIRNGRVCN